MKTKAPREAARFTRGLDAWHRKHNPEQLKSPAMLARLIKKPSFGFALAEMIRECGTQEKKPLSATMCELAAAIFEDVDKTDMAEYADCLLHLALNTEQTAKAIQRFRTALAIYQKHPTRGFGLGLAAVWFSDRLAGAQKHAECVHWFEVAADFAVAHPKAKMRDVYGEQGFTHYLPALEAMGRHEEAEKWRRWEATCIDTRTFETYWEWHRQEQRDHVRNG